MLVELLAELGGDEVASLDAELGGVLRHRVRHRLEEFLSGLGFFRSLRDVRRRPLRAAEQGRLTLDREERRIARAGRVNAERLHAGFDLALRSEQLAAAEFVDQHSRDRDPADDRDGCDTGRDAGRRPKLRQRRSRPRCADIIDG